MSKAKARDLVNLTQDDLKKKPLTHAEQVAAVLLLKAASHYVATTEGVLKAQATELERLRKFEFDHTDHDYTKGC